MTQQDWQKGALAALAYFQKRAADKQPKRKPTWALRLHHQCGQTVILKPQWNRKQVGTDKVEFELWEPLTVNDQLVPTRQLAGVINEEGLRLTQHKLRGLENKSPKNVTREEFEHIRAKSKEQAMEQAESVKDALAEFARDPGAVMARSSDHCCICGKALTDERSKARGIGPECMKFFNFLAELVTRDTILKSVPYEFEDYLKEIVRFNGQYLSTVRNDSLYRADDGTFYIVNHLIEVIEDYPSIKDLEVLILMNDPEFADDEVDGCSKDEMLDSLSETVMLFMQAADKCIEIKEVLDRNEGLVQQAMDYLKARFHAQGQAQA